MLIKWTRMFLLLGMLVSMPACYFMSAHPLPPSAHLDPALLGLWQVEPKEASEEPGWLAFTSDGGFYQAFFFEKNFESHEIYRGSGTDINGEKYLCLQLSKAKENHVTMETEDNYYLVHYRITEGNKLEIRLLDENFIKDAVVQHKMQGQLMDGGDLVLLTGSGADMAAFIKEQKLPALLDKKLLLKAKRWDLPVQDKKQIKPASR
jgi:hypothetical protein